MKTPPARAAGRWRRGLCCTLGLGILPACSSSSATGGGPAVLEVTIGQESDAWTTEPAAQSVRAELVRSTRTTLAEVPAPVADIDLGTDGPSNVVASFEATAFDADANVVMRGSTVPVIILGFTDAHIPLFMGRTGGFSRAPGELLFPRRHPSAAVIFRGGVLLAGGDAPQANQAALDIYDVARWQVAPEQAALPKIPESWAISTKNVLLIDQGGALWLDIQTLATSAVTAPVGFSFADVVGGQTIVGPDDTPYIVGATRTTGVATNSVLRIDSDTSGNPTLHLMKLNTARLGAAAAMVDGQLLVVGGSDKGAGAELSNTAGTGFSPLPFPADATQGAALVATSATTALLAGGRDTETDELLGFRTLDLACSADCAPAPLSDVDFGLDRLRLFSLADGQLAVGESASGETRAFKLVDTGSGHELTEFPLRTPRLGATSLLLPNGQVAIVGGVATTDEGPVTSVEVFFP